MPVLTTHRERAAAALDDARRILADQENRCASCEGGNRWSCSAWQALHTRYTDAVGDVWGARLVARLEQDRAQRQQRIAHA